MNSSCSDCSMYSKIEELRLMLNNLILEKNQELLNKEIITLSQSLDELVYKCIFCSENLNTVFKLNLRNIFGIHSTFYYYGYQHLFSSMYFYINEGINNDELIYISMEENLYNKLISFLKNNNVSIEHIKFRAVKGLIESSANGGLIGLRKEIKNISSEDEVKQYNGVRWIGQPTYAIQTTSQEAFLSWEVNLSEALKNTNISLICIYDAYDYINKREFINEIVIKKSLKTHTHILKSLALEKIC
ncbi:MULTISPECIES: MEDS domain-containing protein [Clostridium]|uniref:MEDS domain-containing protein n=2 Tax=Clostridium TaxID=1485 RepID=A0A0E3JYZ9_CLOSL|nr:MULTISPECIES: MEDS domain-containing protein [Clostridium]AKA67845.1 hypothetical protein CSCA_0720 [Clostridium scatologenes]AWI05741.1 hypothetical protein B9W14_14945 [Clostridium drakei]